MKLGIIYFIQMVITVNYQKRKNQELFQTLEKFNLTKPQNYIPIYQKFFSLNETNYNGINLNHKWYITKVLSKIDNNLYQCSIKNNNTQETKTKQIFFKSAPLLDPFKYMVGKYNLNDATLLNLPILDSTTATVNGKILDVNNSAYVDGFFSYLTSQLMNEYNFIHGLDYYGSFLSVKENFIFNIFDDLDYLVKSDYFNKNKNVLFQVEDYSEKYWDEDTPQKLQPIKIMDAELDNIKENSINLLSDAETLDDSMFDDVFIQDNKDENVQNDENNETDQNNFTELTSKNLREMNLTLEDINDKNKTTTLKSGSSCSSRTSHTKSSDDIYETTDSSESLLDGENINDDSSNKKGGNSSDESETETDGSEECVNAILPKFPVQIICMENCENTLDNLILHNDLSEIEWFSALMQIVMMLITYQKAFAFTHNDLHTNNVMYIKTKKEYIYYCYKKKYYRVPTFGRLFKIIDFGRGVYKFDGKLMCSDSFQVGGDASTQYNFEPYYNDMKARLEPNYSFDLCRLACSMFDYVVDDMDSIKELKECDAITRIIVEWCLDDNGINILYKNNGADRYPDFKLYKMIARHVHKHTPQAQLERKEFSAFLLSKNKVPNNESVMNIDEIRDVNIP